MVNARLMTALGRWGIRAMPAAAAAAAGAISWWGTQVLVNPDRVVGMAIAASCDDARPGTAPPLLAKRFPNLTPTCVRVRLWGPSSDWPGVWGAVWHGGFGIVGAPEGHEGHTVVRDLLVFGGEAPEAAPLAPVAITLRASLWPEDPVVMGVACEDVDVETALGALPCWRLPLDGGGAPDSWVVYVHGRGSSRTQASRIVPVASAAGWTSLVMTYRNDPGAPRTGRYRLGDDEWEDVDAAVSHAREHGARRIVLVGYSMGGAIVQSFLRRSAQADAVSGIILDAPVVDWRAVLHGMARQTVAGRLTRHAVVPLIMATAGWRARIDWRRLDFLKAVSELSVPILLVHGTDDPVVPVASSDRLAAARPDLVTYLRVDGAGHVTSWNHDPESYDAAVAAFLEECRVHDPLGSSPAVA